MITIRPAQGADEVQAAARFCWPAVTQGQGVFGLAGSRSAAGLADAWLALQHHPDDAVLLAVDGDELVGACGVLASDPIHLQTVNGPVVPSGDLGIAVPLLHTALAGHPGATISVGVSDRDRVVRPLLAEHARLVERAWPCVGAVPAAAAAPDRADGVEVVGSRGRDAFLQLHDELMGEDRWWTGPRIAAEWDRWISVVARDRSGLLAARCDAERGESEVFALSSGPSSSGARALLRAWLAEASARGLHRVIAFVDTVPERDAAATCGLACEDEYLLYELDEGTLP